MPTERIKELLTRWHKINDRWRTDFLERSNYRPTSSYDEWYAELEDLKHSIQEQRHMEQNIQSTLAERQNTHGDFFCNATVSRRLKEVMYNTDGWAKLSDVQREALDVIQAKVARILSGNPNESDHWHDISGYAELAKRNLDPPGLATNLVFQEPFPTPLTGKEIVQCNCAACTEYRTKAKAKDIVNKHYSEVM